MLPRLQLHEFRSLNNLIDESRRLGRKVPEKVQAVIGIPRSGMIPAYALALSAGNLPVWTQQSFIAGERNYRGTTRGQEKMTTLPSEIKHALLVDDTILSGNSMETAKQALLETGLETITTCCPFVAYSARDKVDLGGSIVGSPALFEWNFTAHKLVEKACVDFDGVLCFDPSRSQDDDGPYYEQFLKSARPRFVFSNPIGSIVTSRLEKYRPQTEEWLQRNNVQYENLYMLDAPSRQFRTRHEMACSFKARMYVETGAAMFIESELWQARLIANQSGLSVICTDEMRLVTPTPSVRSEFWLRKTAKAIKNRIPGV